MNCIPIGRIATLSVLTATAFLTWPEEASAQPFRVSENGRYLVDESGEGIFLLADTAWALAWRTTREDVVHYVQTRKAQRFNAVALIAFPDYTNGDVVPNVYGDFPLESRDGAWDPERPITTPGNNPDDGGAYDYWDHLEFIIDTAHAEDMWVVLLPAWGGCVAGSYVKGEPNGQVIFDAENAYGYARWIGERFRDKPNVIWMMGGDRSAVYGERDYRPIFRTIAEGVADGVNGVGSPDGDADYSTTLMSYHPRKWNPNSSEWFHGDTWLDFNSMQDEPSDQIVATESDYGRTPAKPTWLFEGGYEYRARGEAIYHDWQIRFQAYQTVFAGAFGTTYGSMNVFHFDRGVEDENESLTVAKGVGWKTKLDEPGAHDMGHLVALMATLSKEQFLDRIPDQALVEGDTGAPHGPEGSLSTCIRATRGAKGDYAFVYSANGREIRLHMDRLAAPAIDAYWFNPREGTWHVNGGELAEQRPFQEGIASGAGAAIATFDPPGETVDGNDWVLVLKAGE